MKGGNKRGRDGGTGGQTNGRMGEEMMKFVAGIY